MIEVDELQHVLFQYRLHDEVSLAIYDARLLREKVGRPDCDGRAEHELSLDFVPQHSN